MREVTTAKSAGFCFGVKRAVDMVYDEAKKVKEYIHLARLFIINR